MIRSHPLRRSLLWLVLSGLPLGCQPSEGPVCYPVRGQLLYRDQPLAEAMVVFHPLGPSGDYPKPLAYTDADGRFELTTWNTRDGAPEGEYAITVELREARLVGEETVRDGRNLLPPQYASPEQTPLRYQVIEGTNEPPPLRLTGGALPREA